MLLLVWLCMGFFVLVHSEKCRCQHKLPRKDWGIYGFDLEADIDTGCRKVFVSEQLLVKCMQELFGLILFSNDTDVVGENVSFAEKEHMVEIWRNITTGFELIKMDMTYCEYIEMHDCYQMARQKMNSTVEKNPTAKAVVDFKYQKTISDFPEVNKLFEEEGPVVNPKNGIYLFGVSQLYGARTFSTYFMMPKNKLASIEYDCNCEEETSHTEFFFIYQLLCTMKKDTDCTVMLNDFRATISSNYPKSDCNSKGEFMKVKTIFSSVQNKGKMSENIIIVCLNGTIKEENYLTFKTNGTLLHTGCDSVDMVNAYRECRHQTEEACMIDRVIEDDGIKYSISVKKEGVIKIQTDKDVNRLTCKKTCEIKIKSDPKRTFITCPDGESKLFLSDKVKESCPFIENYITGRLAVYICRATYHPNLAWFLLFFIPAGIFVIGIIYLIFDTFFCSAYYAIKSCKRRVAYIPVICNDCEDSVGYKELETNHRKCSKGICPYCTFKRDNLKEHVISCKSKEFVLKNCERHTGDVNRVRAYVNGYITRKHLDSSLVRVFYVIVIIILLCIILTPVDANETLSDVIKKADGCEEYCFHSTTSCNCDSGMQSDHVPLQSPGNVVDYKQIYKPSITNREIDLTFNIRSDLSDRITVSGMADVVMNLEENAGTVWKISNPASDESQLITISIKTFEQNYKTEFKRFIADRKVIMGVDNVCVGDCASDCNCHEPSCRVYRQENARKWTCNPKWCWNIGGCSCCTMKASMSDSKYFIAEFDVQYESTQLMVCLSMSEENYKCITTDDTDNFEIDGIRLKIEKVQSVVNYVKNKVYFVLEKKDSKFNLQDPSVILYDIEACNPTNCRHGELGDYSFKDFGLIASKLESKKGGTNMIWNGVQQSMECRQGDWPICNAIGVVEKNTDLFELAIKEGKKLHDDFIVAEGSLWLDGDQIASNLKLIPHSNAGQVHFFMQANNIVLKKKDIPIKIDSFRVHKCVGCYNCLIGSKCEVDVTLKSPNQALIHLISTDKLVIVESKSLALKTEKNMQMYNISIFTAHNISELKLCIKEEPSICATTKKLQLNKLTGRQVGREKILTLMINDTSSLNLSNFIPTLGSFISNFGSNMLGFFKELFTSKWFYYIIAFAIFIFILPTLLSCIPTKKFKKRVNFKGE